MNDLDNLGPGSLKSLLESLLLVSDDSVSATELARAAGAAPGDVACALAELSAEYADANRGFQLREVAGGWRLFTHPAHHDQVADYVMSWDTRRLSQAALETLAVIAYHQPVTREGVRAIRGVNSDGVIGSLREKGLVREVGRGAGRGRGTALYGGGGRNADPAGGLSRRARPAGTALLRRAADHPRPAGAGGLDRPFGRNIPGPL